MIPRMSGGNVATLVRAARLYQDAVWIAEGQPELSWIMLVSAIEAAAKHWWSVDDSPGKRSRTSKGVTRKFVRFVLSFLPDPPAQRPPQTAQHRWSEEAMRRSMHMIYTWRSKALHEGIPFPLPMCQPPHRFDDLYTEKPLGLAHGAGDAAWSGEQTPMLLHTFEYIARNALLKWWKSMVPPSGDGTRTLH